MYPRVLAFDFDGTIAREGIIDPRLREALEQLHLAGCTLFLVTGRRFESISLGSLASLFTGIVWENGAVLSRPHVHEVYTPFGVLSPRLIQDLEAADVPLEIGTAIVSTWEDYEYTVWRVLRHEGCDVGLIRNKGALMILPPGATKGSGCERMLRMCGFSPHNLASFGDGENDASLLDLAEIGITVADAAPSLKAYADVVMDQPGPDGVLQALETYWLGHHSPTIPQPRLRHWINIGKDNDDNPVLIPGSELVGKNLGVFGDSGTGKSWITGLIVEGMQLAGYQQLIIDLEGDYRGLRALSNVMAIPCEPPHYPSPDLIVSVLDTTVHSVVLDLSATPVDFREEYLANILRILLPLRERQVRPHWVVLEEAQFFIEVPEIRVILESTLPSGGYALVSFRPDHIPDPILHNLHHSLITRVNTHSVERAIRQHLGIPDEMALHDIPIGCALLDGAQFVWVTGRRIQHIRHLYKYLDMPLPRHKRFYFHTPEGYLGLEAASLYEFQHVLGIVPLESISYHQARGDFGSWVRTALDDAELAMLIDKLSRYGFAGEQLRHLLIQRVALRYSELQTLR